MVRTKRSGGDGSDVNLAPAVHEVPATTHDEDSNSEDNYESEFHRSDGLVEVVHDLKGVEILDKNKPRWWYPAIDGLRVNGDRWATYSTWDLTPLPGGANRTKWGWLVGKASIKAADVQGLEDWKVVKKFASALSEVIYSPTACYFVKGATLLNVENATDGTKIFPFYNDQQGCILWAAVLRPGKKDVVCAYEFYVRDEDEEEEEDHEERNPDHQHLLLCDVCEPDGIEAFCYRMYLESLLYFHCSSYYGQNSPGLPPDAQEYMETMKRLEQAKNGPPAGETNNKKQGDTPKETTPKVKRAPDSEPATPEETPLKQANVVEEAKSSACCGCCLS